ncbi:MAG TPA: energy transducer TonB [Candidatus Dormibacteraeota bacterium]|nr:energy transducer TonB [Candidatus Dormibacteraeota bacterium]
MIVATLVLGAATFLAAAPPPPATQAKPLRISSVVMQTKLIQTPPLKYPEDARKKNIQGDVALDIVIGTNGSVKSVKVTDGPKELTKAAVNNVKHWRYQPTVLEGKPVEVETTVDLQFKLTKPPAPKSAKGTAQK